jgi:hypothetical protein
MAVQAWLQSQRRAAHPQGLRDRTPGSGGSGAPAARRPVRGPRVTVDTWARYLEDEEGRAAIDGVAEALGDRLALHLPGAGGRARALPRRARDPARDQRRPLRHDRPRRARAGEVHRGGEGGLPARLRGGPAALHPRHPVRGAPGGPGRGVRARPRPADPDDHPEAGEAAAPADEAVGRRRGGQAARRPHRGPDHLQRAGRPDVLHVAAADDPADRPPRGRLPRQPAHAPSQRSPP